MRSDFESVDDDDFPIGGSPPSHDEQDDVGSLKHTTQLYDFVSDDEFGLLGADSGNLLLSEVSEEDTEDLVDSGEFEETGDDDDEEGDEGSEEEMGESLERRHPSIHDSVEHSDDSSRAEEVRGAEDDGGEEEKEEEEEFAKQEVIPKIRFGTSILTEELRESGLGGNPENPFFLRHPSQRRYPSARHHHQSHLFFSGEDHNRILLLKVWTGNGQSPMIVQIQGPQSVENVIVSFPFCWSVHSYSFAHPFVDGLVDCSFSSSLMTLSSAISSHLISSLSLHVVIPWNDFPGNDSDAVRNRWSGA